MSEEGNVIGIGAGQGSYLMTVDLYRLPNGDINAVLQHMPVPVIEAENTISARFSRAADWMLLGALSMMHQAIRFCEETRAANEDSNHAQG